MGASHQFHIDAKNQGFYPIRTQEALEPKWSLEIGPVGYGSVVFGNDGTLYIGTLAGELAAVLPNGTLKWKIQLISPQVSHYPGAVTGSAAIGYDGNIYVVATSDLLIRDHRGNENTQKRIRRSSLHCVTPNGETLWTFPFPENTVPSGLGGYTMSSPKIWGVPNPFIFLPAIYKTYEHLVKLLVIDHTGRLVQSKDIGSYPPDPIVGTGPGFGEILDAIWDFISSPVDFDTSGVAPDSPSLKNTFGLPEPTIAIADYGEFSNRPIILIEDGRKKLAAFRWQSNRLNLLWENVSNKTRFRTTPAVFPNSVIATGDYQGIISFYDVTTGSELWKPWYHAEKPVISPPASFGRQVYFVAGNTFKVIDTNSELWKEKHLNGEILGAPSMSANLVYISSSHGLYTLSFDLEAFVKNEDIKGGVSSPSIGEDGTIYVMDVNSTLWAFGGKPLSRQPIFDTDVLRH